MYKSIQFYWIAESGIKQIMFRFCFKCTRLLKSLFTAREGSTSSCVCISVSYKDK